MKTVLLDLISYIQFAHPTRIIQELDDWFDSLSANDTVIAFLLYEFIPGEPAATCLRHLRTKTVTVLLDDQYRKLESEWTGLNIVYLHYWQLYTRSLSDTPKLEWNAASKKALMLTGKMPFLNRVGALASAYKTKSIQNIVFSFMYDNPEFSKNCVEIINQWGVDPAALMSYCRANKRSIDLDAADIPATSDGSKYYEFVAGIVNVEVVQQTKISIVSETFSKPSGVVTEKIWKTIMCRHPYVLMALPGTTAYLDSLDIKNINHLLPYKSNDIVLPQDVDTAIANAMWFIESSDHYAEVEEIIEHNYQIHQSLSNQSLLQVQYLSKKFNVPELLDTILNRKTEKTMALRKALSERCLAVDMAVKRLEWEEFYNTVRGFDWPTEIPAYNNLPTMVATEMNEMGVSLKNFIARIHPVSEIFIK